MLILDENFRWHLEASEHFKYCFQIYLYKKKDSVNITNVHVSSFLPMRHLQAAYKITMD